MPSPFNRSATDPTLTDGLALVTSRLMIDRPVLRTTTSDAVKRLAPGPSAWGGPQNSGSTDGWDHRLFRLPCWIRVLFNELGLAHGLTAVKERDAVQFMEHAFAHPERRKNLADPVIMQDDALPWGVRRLIERLRSSPTVQSWWRLHNGKSRQINARPMNEAIREALSGGTISPWEYAHFRIPDTLAADGDLVWTMAMAQCTHNHMFQDFEVPNVYKRTEAIYRYFTNPWVRFALAAPLMDPMMMDLGAGFTLNVIRSEFLTRNPFHASTGELEMILSSSTFELAWRKVVRQAGIKDSRLRRPVGPGPIYFPAADGSIRTHPLGVWWWWEKMRRIHTKESIRRKTQNLPGRRKK